MSPNNPILQLFGRSPIRPMQEHMQLVCQCALELIPFFDACHAQDWANAEQLQLTIAQLEEKADNLKLDIRQHLPSGFFLPAPRIDLLQALALQDKIANKARDIAGLMLGRKMCFPDSVLPVARKLLLACVETIEQANKAINELDALLETGFKGQEATFVEELLYCVDKLESTSDEVQVEARQRLFEVEKNLPPIDVMFMYKILDWTGDLADRAEKLGGQLHVILAR